MTNRQAARRGSALLLCFLGGAALAGDFPLWVAISFGLAALLLLVIDWVTH